MMNKNILSLLVISALLAGAIMFGKNILRPAKAEHAVNERPKKLRIGFSPGHAEAERIVRSYKAYETYLERELGIEVDLYKTLGYSGMIEAMRANKIDVATLGPFIYIIAADKMPLDILVVYGTADFGPRIYHSYFITHSNSGIKSMDDVVARSKELVLQFNDPASTSGHLIPRTYLESLGLEAERDFKDVIFGITHTSTILTVVSQKVDLAGVMGSGLDRLIAEGHIDSADVVVLWKSPPIVPSCIVTRTDLPESFKVELRQAYLTMKKKDPAAWEVVNTSWPGKEVEFIAAHDSIYNELRIIANKAKLVNLKIK